MYHLNLIKLSLYIIKVHGIKIITIFLCNYLIFINKTFIFMRKLMESDIARIVEKVILEMKGNFSVGDIVRIVSDNENYDDYRGMDLIITDVSYSVDDHMGYDEGVGGGLYDLETMDGDEVPFSLYDYELQ